MVDAFAKGGLSKEHSPKMHMWGEGAHDEGFITTDPKYRKANLGYLQTIAARLGQVVIPGQSKSGDLGGDQRRIHQAERRGGIQAFAGGGLSDSQISQ